jgi:hydroxymethylpyrimidine pyrophosphatase-like HAD family hydrolase
VTAVEFEKLREQLLHEEFCMIFLLIDVPQDKLMAYQHTKRSSFFTHKGVDKLSGARSLATHLGLDLMHCLGAGDTEMDVFLNGTGLAVLVGNNELEFRGQLQTIKLKNALELGALLFQLVEIQRAVQ